MTAAVLVRITGRVQGVGYRAWVDAEARRRGLAGWVRNRRDGSVEALVAGETSAVDALVADFQHGPPAAAVDEVVAVPAAMPSEPGFRVLPTA